MSAAEADTDDLLLVALVRMQHILSRINRAIAPEEDCTESFGGSVTMITASIRLQLEDLRDSQFELSKSTVRFSKPRRLSRNC
jgi:hypothetical protein